ncbi:radical SAM protein [Methanohalobium sp.]|uniref:radical SAM protein n=1 Tax=Methanohalobium sp. TaxID=2837493 RepID=UPI0025FA3A36|nr:radical SAM protein [Methanohalobium sp.]
MNNFEAVIIDGYVDEPACFGVPPYLSPYPRYIAGALHECNIEKQNIHYTTIDQLRKSSSMKETIKQADTVIIIAGMTVPGKYLRASPITLNEIESVFKITSGSKILGGPIRLGFSKQGGESAKKLGINVKDVYIAKEDIEAFVYDFLQNNQQIGNIIHRQRTVEEIGRWAINGAFIHKQHPDHPHIICELETYRGCGRYTHCSFCTEPFYKESKYRPVDDIISEVSELYNSGARYFRIGRQPDLFTYQSIENTSDISEPNPEAIEKLYRGIRDEAPDLQVLHMDNVNPATIARYPDKSRKILDIILKYHTPGDVCALGMESADPDVVSANNLKATPEEVFEAIKIINEKGGKRGYNGLPEILPGLNFVYGLKGETKKTFKNNYDFLIKILDSGLLVRRINLRQVVTFPGTPIYGKDTITKKHNKLFLNHKEKVREHIDKPMLRKLVPEGTILKNVLCEVHKDGFTFGRQLGSYPLLVGIPELLPENKFIDIVVTGHGNRSITGIPYPLRINEASLELISEIPGIGKNQAAEIYKYIPFKDENDFMKRVEYGEKLINYISL